MLTHGDVVDVSGSNPIAVMLDMMMTIYKNLSINHPHTLLRKMLKMLHLPYTYVIKFN